MDRTRAAPASARIGERGFFSFFGWSRRSNIMPEISKRKVKPEPVLSRANLVGPLVPLKVKGEDIARPDDTYAGALYDRLNGEAQGGFTVRADRAEPIIEFYKERNFAPLWVGENGLKERARKLLAQLATANLDGLRRQEYQPRSLVGFDPETIVSATDPAGLSGLELELTRAALRYARDISSGMVVPSKVSRAIDVQPKVIKTEQVLATLAAIERPDIYLQNLAPQTDSYRKLKQTLAVYRELERNGGWTVMPRVRKMKPGAKSRAVALLRQRLVEQGLYDAPQTEEPVAVDHEAEMTTATADDTAPATSEAIVYDKTLVDAVKKFQALHGLKVDGVVGGQTIATLNVPVSKRISQLIVNLERRRWLPDNLGESYVLVNQAAFQLRMYDGGKMIHKTRVIVGKRSHQTPEFSNRIKLVVFNPYWNVPRSIAIEEMLPKLLANPGSLSENFEIFGRRGPAGSSYDIDWDEAVENGFPYSIRQKPGAGNALGYVKFLFPNRHNVYLHDTPSRGLFSRLTRSLSHGCVRVQHAQQFAKIIMGREGWTGKEVSKAVNLRKNRQVKLEREIPVHLTYRTVWIDDDGGIHFQNDFYGRDQRLQLALGHLKLAMK